MWREIPCAGQSRPVFGSSPNSGIEVARWQQRQQRQRRGQEKVGIAEGSCRTGERAEQADVGRKRARNIPEFSGGGCGRHSWLSPSLVGSPFVIGSPENITRGRGGAALLHRGLSSPRRRTGPASALSRGRWNAGKKDGKGAEGPRDPRGGGGGRWVEKAGTAAGGLFGGILVSVAVTG